MPSSPAVRTFRRSDRHQLTDLVNRHAAAVLPGVSTSVNTVLSSLEARPDEYVVDPWVAERLTLVTEHHGRVVAAAHLHRYRDEPDVGPTTGEPRSSNGSCTTPATASAPGPPAPPPRRRRTSCSPRAWRPPRGGRHAGFRPTEHFPARGCTASPLSGRMSAQRWSGRGSCIRAPRRCCCSPRCADRPTPVSRPGGNALTLLRTLGSLGTRFTAFDGDRVLGHLELDTTVDRPERVGRGAGLAELADVEVDADAPEGAEQTLPGARRGPGLADSLRHRPSHHLCVSRGRRRDRRPAPPRLPRGHADGAGMGAAHGLRPDRCRTMTGPGRAGPGRT